MFSVYIVRPVIISGIRLIKLELNPIAGADELQYFLILRNFQLTAGVALNNSALVQMYY